MSEEEIILEVFQDTDVGSSLKQDLSDIAYDGFPGEGPSPEDTITHIEEGDTAAVAYSDEQPEGFAVVRNPEDIRLIDQYGVVLKDDEKIREEGIGSILFEIATLFEARFYVGLKDPFVIGGRAQGTWYPCKYLHSRATSEPEDKGYSKWLEEHYGCDSLGEPRIVENTHLQVAKGTYEELLYDEERLSTSKETLSGLGLDVNLMNGDGIIAFVPTTAEKLLYMLGEKREDSSYSFSIYMNQSGPTEDMSLGEDAQGEDIEKILRPFFEEGSASPTEAGPPAPGGNTDVLYML